MSVGMGGGRDWKAKKYLSVGAKQELLLGAASLMYLKQQGASVKYFAYAGTLGSKYWRPWSSSPADIIPVMGT